ncbi:MAG: prolipoprotein diacylglyceryl transferase [Clostridia bacterium]|nr:prolipoprotein diacylglyceryl transferase [Clostridia bacterium]
MKSLLSSLTVYPYGVVAAFALIAFLGISIYFAYLMKQENKRIRTDVCTVIKGFAAGLPIGLILSRLIWVVGNYYDYSLKEPLEIISISLGGLSMWGFILGFWLACTLVTRLSGASSAHTMDAFTPGFMLFIAIMRFAEVFTGQGIGRIVSYDFLSTPLTAVYDTYHEARFAVFQFEGVYALILFFIVFFALKKCIKSHSNPGGDLWRLAVGAYAFLQIVFESMRDDDFIRFGFVRVSQAISILFLIILAFYFIVRLKKKHILGANVLWMPVLNLAAAALVIYEEFQVDGAIHAEINYLIMFIGSLLMYAPSLYAVTALSRHKKAKQRRLKAGKRRR